MHHHDHSSSQPGQQPGGFWRSRYAIGMLVFGAIAGYFLWTEHRAHLQQWWPYALLLACPLMHIFMHKGHGGHGGHGGDSNVSDRSPSQNSDRS